VFLCTNPTATQGQERDDQAAPIGRDPRARGPEMTRRYNTAQFDKLERAIKLARALEAAGHEVFLVTEYSGTILVDLKPDKFVLSRRAPYCGFVYVTTPLLLDDRDGFLDFECESPSKDSLTSFRFQVDDEVISYEAAARLLMRG